MIKLDTQRFLFSSAKEYPDFAEAMWADSIPKLLQAKLLESFENYDIAHAPLRSMDGVQADYQLLIDIRRFQITTDPEPVADIGLSARILNKNGKVRCSAIVPRYPEAGQDRTSGGQRSVQRCIRTNRQGHDRVDR